MSFHYSPNEKAALEAACETLIPSLKGDGNFPEFWASTAKDMDVAGQILDLMGAQSPAEQAEFRQLLGILDSKIAGLLFGGSWAKFREMPLERRVKILQKWMGSRFNALRKAFGTLKKLTMFLHYGSHLQHQNPTWKPNAYQGAWGSPAGQKARIQPLDITQDTELTCDVVVVGSGAGGGLAAGLLAEAGLDVVLLEKGPFLSGEEFSEHEVEMIRKTYDKQGAFQTKDGGATIFAGACLGGGTTINWTGAFHTPDYVLEEWTKDHGLAFATNGEYQQSMARVWADFNVNADNSPHNPQNQALWRGSEKLGEKVQVIDRNVEGCAAHPGTESCGYCGMGCRRGNKRGTLATYIQRAADKAARIVVGAEVQKLLHTNGQAQGVEAEVRTSAGKLLRLRVKAKRVVLAAGSIHTPAILLRSGISHEGIGKNLFFHPTVGVTGYYGEAMNPWLGVMMSAVNKEHIRLDGNYGFWVETPPLHPGVGAMSLAWENPGLHKGALMKASHLGAFIVLTRDKFGGRVTVDKTGHAVVDYKLADYDRNHMFAGMKKAFEIHRAAGALAVTLPHVTPKTYKLQTSKMSADDWLGRMPSWGWKANQFALFTAHQMGTCAMGSDPQRHPVDPAGQLRVLKNVFVADGSLMPTSAGINPMMSIMALADHVVRGMI
jgi:choline dehydrogenase-like flavoprotein